MWLQDIALLFATPNRVSRANTRLGDEQGTLQLLLCRYRRILREQNQVKRRTFHENIAPARNAHQTERLKAPTLFPSCDNLVPVACFTSETFVESPRIDREPGAANVSF